MAGQGGKANRGGIIFAKVCETQDCIGPKRRDNRAQITKKNKGEKKEE
jgi:hypothetical protein